MLLEARQLKGLRALRSSVTTRLVALSRVKAQTVVAAPGALREKSRPTLGARSWFEIDVAPLVMTRPAPAAETDTEVPADTFTEVAAERPRAAAAAVRDVRVDDTYKPPPFETESEMLPIFGVDA